MMVEIYCHCCGDGEKERPKSESNVVQGLPHNLTMIRIVVDRITFRWPFGKQFRSINGPKQFRLLMPFSVFGQKIFLWPKEIVLAKNFCFGQLIGKKILLIIGQKSSALVEGTLFWPKEGVLAKRNCFDQIIGFGQNSVFEKSIV